MSHNTIDGEDLAIALESRLAGIAYVLDRDAGEVIPIPSKFHREAFNALAQAWLEDNEIEAVLHWRALAQQGGDQT